MPDRDKKTYNPGKGTSIIDADTKAYNLDKNTNIANKGAKNWGTV